MTLDAPGTCKLEPEFLYPEKKNDKNSKSRRDSILFPDRRPERTVKGAGTVKNLSQYSFARRGRLRWQ
jgi:hypothetical protein